MNALDALLSAARPLLAAPFALWGTPVTWLEMLAFALSIGMVLANLRVNPVGWPLAIAASGLYALLYADSRLYGQAALQFVFIAVAAWGWWQWVGRRSGEAPLRVRAMTPRGRWIAFALTLAAWPLLALSLARATDSPSPWLDALPTVASVTGQILLGRKLIENWPTWLAVNVFSVVLFVTSRLWLTALLYAIFAVLSVVGWRAWRTLAARGAHA